MAVRRKTIYQQALANADTGTDYPFTVAEGVNFGSADAGQRAALQNAAGLYGSGGDWQSAVNSLRTDGNMVSYTDENGLPVGALRSVSGQTNGEYLWALNGRMTDGTVPEGTVLYAGDGSRWTVGADGSLSSAPAGTAISGSGGVGAIGYTGNAPAAASNGNRAVNRSDAGGSPSVPGGTVSASSSSTSTPYQTAISAYDNAYGSAPTYGGSPYDEKRDDYLQRAANMSFNYDPSTDPSWQAYQKQYRREGQRAAQDALGQYAAMTGGTPSSWAVTAASQAGDYYAAQLSDKLPELYNDAYNRYLQEYQRMLGLSQEYGSLGQTDYNRYLDQLSQWNTDRSFQYGLDRDALEDARYDDETAWNRSVYQDELERADRQEEYNRALQAAELGDYSLLEALGIQPSGVNVYAYADDGGSYQIGTDRGRYFLEYAGAGQTMTGGDGSTWVKNADGSVTITKDGRRYTVAGTGAGSYTGEYYSTPYTAAIESASVPSAGSPRATGEASEENVYNMQSVGDAQRAVQSMQTSGASTGAKQPDENTTVTNRNGESWCTVEGLDGRFSWQELLNMVENGTVREIYNPAKNTITYRAA